MLTANTNYVQSEAFEYDDQTLQDQNPVIQSESLLLNNYHILYTQYQELLEDYPINQGLYSCRAEYHQTLQNYRQSQQELRRLIHQFRQTMHEHLKITGSYRNNQNYRKPAARPIIRKTILLGVSNEKNASSLKESVQQVSTHRVFLAADSNQALCLLQNVHIDLLVLDDELTPLPGIELYNHLHSMKWLKAIPAIIMSACFSPLLQVELALYNLIGLEKPIKVVALVKAIDQLLV